MAAKTKGKTWEEIKASNEIHPLVIDYWPTLCDAWGQSNGMFVYCRLPKRHLGPHMGLREPGTRIGWTA